MSDSPPDRAGWHSDLPTFHGTTPQVVVRALESFVADASDEQRSAWSGWIPQLQRESLELVIAEPSASNYWAILEYRLPRDGRRPDVIVLEQGVVVVLELKGPDTPLRAGLDQVLAYARDLRAYHIECHERPVVPVLVQPMAKLEGETVDGAWVVAPRGLDGLLQRIGRTLSATPITPDAFLADDTYCPLPSIVDAARDLFEHGDLPYIKRARACTDPALETIANIAKEAAATKTRHLVFLQGVPGSGKTLVGLQVVHARWLKDLAVLRADGRPRPPAVYLSGNGPLVAVMQHALASAGAGGKTFVQGVKEYIAFYSKKKRVPPEHLVVFDEAQRAHDAAQFAKVHKQEEADHSEPAHLLQFMERVPDWCVLVALVGTGQAIHVGEEAGLPLWREALLRATAEDWTVHAPSTTEEVFAGDDIKTRWHPSLSLDTELRHHLVPRVHELVEYLVEKDDAEAAARLAAQIHADGHRFLITRSLDSAKVYLRSRYDESPRARYGLIASSRCKHLESVGVDNSFQTTKRLKVGPWYNAPATDALSCRALDTVVTEFQAQGLELDMALLAWGTDFRRHAGRWNSDLARRHKDRVADPHALRRNAYRVLLTRGRDGTIIYVPELELLDETWKWLLRCGAKPLESQA
ncbi:MAG: DUF2075 domain-containing protein [Planctomycetota bacterium]|nr:DUF2075 domain-containing protein [Planctomycetota bacterium]